MIYYVICHLELSKESQKEEEEHPVSISDCESETAWMQMV